MARRSAAALALLALASLSAPTARASHCDATRRVVIFSHASGVNTPDVAPLVCLVTEGHDADPRVINPGSDGVSVRYRGDIPSVESVEGTIDGLGFESKPIRLVRGETPFGVVYDSPVYAIPGGTMSSGCLTASLTQPPVSNSFHTVDASCANESD